ncbi:MAG: hypothetical protein ACI4UM_01050 [Succinivibrio sp.]
MFSKRLSFIRKKEIIDRIEHELKSSLLKEDSQKVKDRLIFRSGMLLENRLGGLNSRDLMKMSDESLDIVKKVLAMKVSRTKFPLVQRGNSKRLSQIKSQNS